MMLYLSRLMLKRHPSVAALRELIDPKNRARAMDAHHRLLWHVFSETGEEKRDFLWRAEPRGRFYALSHRPPTPHDLFERPEVKEFSPTLSAGDRLAFLLRANATRALPGPPLGDGSGKHARGRNVDVAMHLLKDVSKRTPSDEPGSAHQPSPRAEARHDIAAGEACKWLERQGEANGFSLDAPADGSDGSPRFVLEHYYTVTLPGYRGKRRGEPRFGVFEMKGMVTVTDPAAFIRRLGEGFGRAKAYGCGLMLIRRA